MKKTVNSMNTLIVAAPDFVGRLVGRRVVNTQGSEFKKISAEVCSSVLAWDIKQLPIDGVAFAGFHTGWQDLRITANLVDGRNLSWLSDTELVIGDFYSTQNEIISFAPRSILQKQIRELSKLGYSAVVATELEFYLIPIDETREINPQKHDFSVDATTNGMAIVFDEVIDTLKNSGVTVESWQAEWGLGQWEVNLKRGNPLEVADSHTIFKMAVKEIALKHGYTANFMAKPFSTEVGSSCHIHVSLKDKSGNQIFFDESKEFSLSTITKSAVAGILHYTPQSMPMYASTINSYRRLAASEFCGNGATWGFDNRTATCRVLGHDSESLHIEFRIPGADANQYLALAGLLASIRKGITEKMQLSPALSGDAGSKNIEKYPSSLESATQNFLSSPFIQEEFGEDFISEYGSHLNHEINLFKLVVTDWEVERYSSVI